jgi:cellulose synthase/poly-beta-1,6-N-acetylglucosamine synthase-like glycosyltransferase
VIITARNEEKNIARLLKSLRQQSYPAELTEIIVIDDHSTDDTVSIVRTFNFVKLIRLPDEQINSYKKKAIETGIAAAGGELIITTDADCLPEQNWLKTIVSFKAEKDAVFIAAPVVLECNNSVLEVFQAMDFMILQGITGASVHKNIHSMCNGANLAYERKVFYDVDGFAGIDHIASGDDMLLMYKIRKKYPDKVHYLKTQDAMVYSLPMKTWKGFLNQRIRWASKAKIYEDRSITAVLLIVYLFNIFFLVLFVAGCWSRVYWYYLLICWIAKTLVELPLFIAVADFFKKRWAIKFFFFFQPLHIMYTIISGLFGQFGKYEWKGRKVK